MSLYGDDLCLIKVFDVAVFGHITPITKECSMIEYINNYVKRTL